MKLKSLSYWIPIEGIVLCVCECKLEYQFPCSLSLCVLCTKARKKIPSNTYIDLYNGVISVYWNLIKNLIEIMIDDINDGIEII